MKSFGGALAALRWRRGLRGLSFQDSLFRMLEAKVARRVWRTGGCLVGDWLLRREGRCGESVHRRRDWGKSGSEECVLREIASSPVNSESGAGSRRAEISSGSETRKRRSKLCCVVSSQG